MASIDVRKQLHSIEAEARKQIAALKKRGAPITDASRKQALKAVRKLRTELNRNLMKVEKALAPPKKAKKAKKAKKRTAKKAKRA